MRKLGPGLREQLRDPNVYYTPLTAKQLRKALKNYRFRTISFELPPKDVVSL